MEILVIGGTRFIGRAVAAELFSRHHTVHLFHRGKTPNDLAQAREIRGDRYSADDLARALRRTAPDAVVDMVAMTPRAAATTMKVLQDTGFSGPYLLVSSVDVYARFGEVLATEPAGAGGAGGYVSEDSPLRENLYPYAGRDLGGWAEEYDKIPVEQAFARHDGTRILRLPAVFGPRDPQRRIAAVLEALRAGKEPRPQVRWDWRSPYAFVESCARAAAGLLLDAHVVTPSAYHLQDAAPSERELWTAVAEAAELPVPEFPEEEGPAVTAPDLVLDTSAIDQAVPLWRSVSFEEGVKLTVEAEG